MSTDNDKKITPGAFLLGPTDPSEVFIPEQFDEEARMLGQSVEEFVTEQVLPLFDSGKLRPIVDRTFSLEEIRAAHEYMETNANFGKIVVAVS